VGGGEAEALIARLQPHGNAGLNDEAVRDLECLLDLARRADGPALAHATGSCSWLRDLYGRYACQRELAEADALRERGTGIPGLDQGEGGDFAGRAYGRVRDLFQYIDFRGCRVFVLVGCGPLPVTLLHVAHRTQVPRLIGLEVEPEAARRAGALCRGLGVGRLEIRDCDGGTFDYRDADVVYVANLVRPKRAVLGRVADTIAPGARVVVREPSPAGELFAERGVDAGDPRWRELARGPEDTRFLSYNLFLESLDRR